MRLHVRRGVHAAVGGVLLRRVRAYSDEQLAVVVNMLRKQLHKLPYHIRRQRDNQTCGRRLSTYVMKPSPVLSRRHGYPMIHRMQHSNNRCAACGKAGYALAEYRTLKGRPPGS